MPQQTLNELTRRSAKYWNADGLPDLITGLWMLWGGA